ncbi:hypothetical protein [Salmonirosea aquatica]|uniref:hypothetical protein n=1 Tax=Salmonirosea aquatica TaxID=2654236 RepID=UPI0035711D26
MVICIDFDGTCVTHAFPKVGEGIGAEAVLKDLIDQGHRLILFTMRSDTKHGKYLTDALDWFKSKGIELYGVNKNPTQHTWTTSPKAAADLYIDDLALGIPLTTPKGSKPHVDWSAARQLLTDAGILKETDEEQEALARLIYEFPSTQEAQRLGLWD